MSLALVKLHLSSALSKLGTSKDAKSAPPEGSTDNRFAIAWEYFVADLLCSLATKRRKVAKEAAEEAGILVKPDEGETKIVYNSDGLQIVAKTKTAAETIDPVKLSALLIKELGAAKAQKIIKDSKKKNAPATTFDVVGAD